MPKAYPADLSPYKWAIAILALAGIAERASWNLVRPTVGAAGEAHNIAVAIASGAGFADAYRIGQGPTAHMLPINPLIAGGAYHLFGVNSMAAEILLACWSIGLAIGSYLLLYRAFGRLGVARNMRLTALAVGCLAPAYIGQEAVDFRVWEGGLAVFLVALFLDRLLAIEVATPRVIILMALLNALIFFVNPMLGLAAYGCSAIFCLRNLPPKRLITAAACAGFALALFLGPWAARNAAVLGAPVLLRSNAGLELALSISPHALDSGDRAGMFRQRLLTIHPTDSQRAYRAMRAAGGEVAYSHALGERATHWIVEHPGDTALLGLRHLRQTFIPEPWQFSFVGSGILAGTRAVIAGAAGLFGLAGIALALLRRRPAWGYPAMLILVPGLLMCLFQPIPRYTYLLYPMLLFCAASLFPAGLYQARVSPFRRVRHPIPTHPAA